MDCLGGGKGGRRNPSVFSLGGGSLCDLLFMLTFAVLMTSSHSEGKSGLATEEDNPFVGFQAKGAAAKKLEWQLAADSATATAPVARTFAANSFEESNAKKSLQSDYMTFDKGW